MSDPSDRVRFDDLIHEIEDPYVDAAVAAVQADADAAAATAAAALPAAQVGVAGGVAELDADGVLPSQRVPYLVPQFDASPTLLAHMREPRYVSAASEGGIAISADGNYLYGTSHTNGALVVVDISDRQCPYVAGYLAHANLASASGVAVLDDDHVVVACDTANRFTVVDVSNPASPSIAGTTTTGLSGVHVAVDGDYAYVAARTGNALVIINCANPAAPAQAGRLLDATNLQGARSVAVAGDYAYVTAFTAKRLTIVDVTDKTDPVLAGTVNDATNLNGAYGLALSADATRAYVGAQTGTRLTVVDTTTKSAPAVLGSVAMSSGHQPTDVALVGTTAMVGTRDGAIHRVDVTTPAAPTEIDALLGGHQFHAPALRCDAVIERMALGSDILALGCTSDGSIDLFGPRPIMPAPAGAGVVILGDSITNRNGNGNTAHANRGYFTWANAILGQALSLLWNGGVDSDTTAGVLARLYRSALVFRPSVVVLEVGTNDFTQAAATGQIDTTIANYRRIVAALRAAGCQVIACTMIPRVAGQFALGAPIIKEFYAFNTWLRSFATATPGVHLCDWYRALADDTTGEPLTSPAVTVDGTHPNPEGARRMGTELAAVFTSLGIPASARKGFGNGDTNNLLTNGQLDGDVAGVATGWTVTGTATPTKEARTDADGDWQQLASMSGTVLFAPTVAPAVPASGDGAIGSLVMASVEVEVDAGASFTELSLRIRTNGPSSLDYYDFYPAETTAVTPSGAMTLQTSPISVVQVSTAFTWELKFVGTGTVRVGSARLSTVARF